LGVDLGGLVIKEKIVLDSLAGRKIAIDANNALYQFLSIIRQKDGTPLMDAKGRITSHLSGLFYRTARLLEIGVKPIYIFDGKPPAMKKTTLGERHVVREEAQERWKAAKAAGDLEGARKYAQASSRLTPEMVAESKKLLEYMGVPHVQAPSEGEAQAAQMANKKEVDLCSSQDYDALLFGAPQLARNITISGRRKVPGRDVYVEVEPEVIDLERSLAALGINRKQLIWLAILIGTDFNEGVKGYGPKKALKLVKECASLSACVAKSGGVFEIEPKEVEEFFLNPPTVDSEFEFGEPDVEKIISFLCSEHGFSEDRVKSAVEAMAKKAKETGEQSTLGKWS